MLTRLMTLASALFFSLSLNAAVVDQGDWLLDTTTGLEWLKLTNTQDTSYFNAVAAYPEASIASFDQLNYFLSQLTDLESYIGDTGILWANIVDGPALGCVDTEFLVCAAELPALDGELLTGVLNDVFKNSSYSVVATAMYRTAAVPVPAAAYLFFSALASLLVRKRWAA